MTSHVGSGSRKAGRSTRWAPNICRASIVRSSTSTRTRIRTGRSSSAWSITERMRCSMRFEDKEGSEEIYVNAQKDYRRVVKNDDSLTVTQGNRTIEVKQGNVSETLDTGNKATKLSQGNHSVKLDAGASSVDAMQSITLTVGSNSITIDQTG